MIEDKYAVKKVYVLKFCLVFLGWLAIVPAEAIGATEIFMVSNDRISGFYLWRWLLIVWVVLWSERG